jgi:hypothetical protein
LTSTFRRSPPEFRLRRFGFYPFLDHRRIFDPPGFVKQSTLPRITKTSPARGPSVPRFNAVWTADRTGSACIASDGPGSFGQIQEPLSRHVELGVTFGMGEKSLSPNVHHRSYITAFDVNRHGGPAAVPCFSIFIWDASVNCTRRTACVAVSASHGYRIWYR